MSIEGRTVPKITAVTAYSVAMGYLEAAVVIYLRTILFGDSGRIFPFSIMPPPLSAIEIGREAATIVMLLTIAFIAGSNRIQRGMYFVYSFALWDLTYYCFLRLLTGWPSSALDYDVLFLIPFPWTSPVICPILISLLLISTSLILIVRISRGKSMRISKLNAAIFLTGCVADLYSFTHQIVVILVDKGPGGLEGFIPHSFEWPLFLAGFFMLGAAAVRVIRECR